MDTNNEPIQNQDQNSDNDGFSNERLISDHEYDGIQELDNDMPPWWKYLFYITIIISFVYFFGVHVFGFIDHQNEKYEKEMANAKLSIPEVDIINAKTAVVVKDEGSLADGKETFDKICSVCHGKFGEGLIGPNFTDEYWIHGGGMEDLFTVVIEGVPAKGMISYKAQLSGKKIQNVLSYILNLQETDPPNQKAAEGELWIAPEEEISSEADSLEIAGDEEAVESTTE